MMPAPPKIRYLGLQPYEPVWQDMKRFTDQRSEHTEDELWLVQHSPVFTLGQAGKAEHVLNPGDIPVVQCDRGGQVTYHGPGQLVCYLLLDLRRLGSGVRHLVDAIEQSIVRLVDEAYGIKADTGGKAPGVYVKGSKLAALGLRIRKGSSYHGLSINVDMDITPFGYINPCGYEGLEIVQLKDFGVTDTPDQVAEKLLPLLIDHLGYNASP